MSLGYAKLFAAPSLPEFPVASGFWLRIKVGLLAVYKNSKSRQEAEAFEIAARREYLPDHLQSAVDLEPIVLPPWDPMGALAR